MEEIAALTLGAWLPIPGGAPDPMSDPEMAEREVRARFPGDRELLGVERVAMRVNSKIRIGYFVALTPERGVHCSVNAALLPRPIEGGIVDDQTCDLFWVFGCPESFY